MINVQCTTKVHIHTHNFFNRHHQIRFIRYIVAHIDFFSKLGIHIAVIITGCVVQLQVQSCLFNMMHSATCVLKYVV